MTLWQKFCLCNSSKDLEGLSALACWMSFPISHQEAGYIVKMEKGTKVIFLSLCMLSVEDINFAPLWMSTFKEPFSIIIMFPTTLAHYKHLPNPSTQVGCNTSSDLLSEVLLV